MGNEKKGQFYVAQLDDGRFIAVASSAPYFCFRANSEEAVVEKVRAALHFCKSRTQAKVSVGISKAAAKHQTVVTVRAAKRLSFNEVMQEAA